MPVAFAMRLRPRDRLPPVAVTRQVHGLACSLFEADGAAHDSQQKLFSIWPILTDAGSGGELLLWRASWFGNGAPPKRVETIPWVRLGAQPLRICGVDRREVRHADLAAGPTLRSVTLAFRSPVFFSRNGTDDLTPDPRLILGSHRRRWNAGLSPGDPLLIDDETWHDTHRFVRLTAYDLATCSVDAGHGRNRAGFAGTATLYADRTAPRAAVSVFSALVRFAPFCGTGAQTTHGFGATELIGCVTATDRNK